jgi:tRNA (guanine-N7-)-methyltransferase
MEHSFERLTTPGPDGKKSPLSYVIRAGHMTERQKDALHRLYEQYGIRWEPGKIVNSLSLFGPVPARPFIVEIGFGMGDATARIAKELPGYGFFGVEVHAPGVGQMLLEIERQGIENLRVCRHDAMEVVESMLAPDSVDGFMSFSLTHGPRRSITNDGSCARISCIWWPAV